MAQQQPGSCWLFFGCRKVNEDYLYRQDFEAFEADGTLSRLSCAFSRAQQDKVYVQHLMREQVRPACHGCMVCSAACSLSMRSAGTAVWATQPHVSAWPPSWCSISCHAVAASSA